MRPHLPATLLLALFLLNACRTADRGSELEPTEPPTLLLGDFRDDYGGTHEVTPTLWTQFSNTPYRIVRWVPEERYLIARNDSTHPTAPNLWSRIDWIVLTEMAPYEWAFCLSAYDAPSAEAAEATEVADSTRPRIGCNGFPYTRMEPVGGPEGAPDSSHRD